MRVQFKDNIALLLLHRLHLQKQQVMDSIGEKCKIFEVTSYEYLQKICFTLFQVADS